MGVPDVCRLLEALMAVFVDDMYRTRMGRLGRMKMSHMMADTEEELQQLARTIGLKPSWYQGDHYDVSLGFRKKAVFAGAIEVTMREMAQMRRSGRLFRKRR